MKAVDLFAGPGGWDLAAVELGIEVRGIEWDDAACQTRAAAGLHTHQADVSKVDPSGYEGVCDLLIASPPCQAFSMAGSGAGRKAMSAYHEAIQEFRHTASIDYASLDEACSDPRAHLVLEPLRWADELRPDYIALEQVRPVLPLWEEMAGALMDMGYRTWTGLLSSEQYGVPQTRVRAILLASRVGDVSMPPPTHARYVPGRVKPKQEGSLFGAPEPERVTLPEDSHLLPWVSMAEALGWVDGEAPPPAPTVTSGGTAQGGVEVFASKASRGRASRAVAFRATNDRPNVAVRPTDAPAPALAFGHNPPRWVVEYRRGGERLEESTPVAAPATTVNCDPRIAEAGHHDNHQNNAIRVQLSEALVLQSFPPDYPVQGTKSKQFEQVGNAVPPLMAYRILEHLLR